MAERVHRGYLRADVAGRPPRRAPRDPLDGAQERQDGADRVHRARASVSGRKRIANGEIYSAANDRDQAAIIFKFAKQIVELEPELRAEVEIIASTKTMIARRTGSIYRAISAEAGTKHGYLPSLVIYDELAQAKNRDLYDVLDTSFGACEEPLFIVISTQSNDPEHILSQLIDDGQAGVDPTIVCHLHAADEDCELDDSGNGKRPTRRSGVPRSRRPCRGDRSRPSGCRPRSRRSETFCSISACRRRRS